MSPKPDTSKERKGTRSWLEMFLDTRYALLLIFVLVLITFINSLPNDFSYDDQPYIVNNTVITSLKYLPRIFTEPYPPHMPELGLYRPLVELSYMVDYALGLRHTELEQYGFKPVIDTVPFHISNSLLHFAVCVIVFFIVRCLFSRESFIPVLSVALFAVHPVHVEVVASVVGRAESMSTLFYLFALYLVIRSPLRASYRAPSNLFSYLLFFFALLSKEMAITLPAILIIYIVLFRDVEFREISKGRSVVLNLILFALPYFAVFMVYLVIRVHVVGHFAISEASRYFASHPKLPRFPSMLVVYLVYLKMMVFPDVLLSDYNFPIPFIDGIRIPPPGGLFEPLPLVGLLALALSVGAGLYLLTRRNQTAFPILWFLVTLFPVSNIIPFGDIMAERFLYLPSVGFCIGGGWIFAKYMRMPGSKPFRPDKRTRTALLVFGFVIICMMYRSIHRNVDWRDNISLWKSVIRVDPGNRDAYYAIGHSYSDLRKYHLEHGNVYVHLGRSSLAQEHLALAAQYEDLAKEYYYKSIEVYPEMFEAYHNLAVLLKEARNPDLQEAARLEHYIIDHGFQKQWKHFDTFYSMLGNIYGMMKQYDKSVLYFKRAIRFKPDNMDYYVNLGSALAAMGNFDMAEKMWRYVLKRDPVNEDAQANLKRLEEMRSKKQ